MEPQATPSLTKGLYAFDYGDTAQMAPIMKMFTLGHDFVPPPNLAGGLRYHGMAPQICMLYEAGFIDAVAVPQPGNFQAGVLFAQTEGIIPAPETAHAIRAAIDEALDAKEKGEERVILFNLSGHGLLDLAAYDDYHQGHLVDDALEVSTDDIRNRLPRWRYEHQAALGSTSFQFLIPSLSEWGNYFSKWIKMIIIFVIRVIK